ncbi:MAG: carboxypeptidase-like regulatory domain-containing protein [Dehalococcoidia bacterium]
MDILRLLVFLLGLLLGVSDGLAALPDDGEGLIRGTVIQVNRCRNESPDMPCADLRLPQTEVEVRDHDGTVVKTVISDLAGRFEVSLPPGNYTLQTRPVGPFLSTPAEVDLDEGEIVEVRLIVRPAIR